MRISSVTRIYDSPAGGVFVITCPTCWACNVPTLLGANRVKAQLCFFKTAPNKCSYFYVSIVIVTGDVILIVNCGLIMICTDFF